ncbi:hypothetical protein QJS04_geneDACA020440 [Acorus gramineus]|uniref:Uncharacterized protein n=1 Tax=Acorus gramineus TaxID=55184 RepID=A0AAV9BUD6_ACOGR|nr:hypothetical protein QJS04_geneDACA020440 [Acorus gramineus]
MTTTAQPNSSYASELHSDINQIVKSGRVFAYWITALSFAGIISIICVYLEDKTSDKIHKPLFTACILFVGVSFTTGLGLIALLWMAAHFSTHNLIQSFIVLHKTLECCGLGFVALAFGTGSSLLFGKMLVNLIFIIPIVIIAIRLALMFCCKSNGNSSENAV